MISLHNLLNTNDDILISVRTRDKFNTLMKFLEAEECRWSQGTKPTSNPEYWNAFGTYTVIRIRNKYITYGDVDRYSEMNYCIGDGTWFELSDLDFGRDYYNISFEEIY